MKMYLCLLLSFIVHPCTTITSNENVLSAASHERTMLVEHDDIEKIVETFYKAMVDKNESVLKDMCAQNLTYGHSSARIETRNEFIYNVVNGSFNFLKIEAKDQSVYKSGNTTIVRHIFTANATNEGKSVDLRLGCVLVFQKQEGAKWKLVVRQGYKLP